MDQKRAPASRLDPISSPYSRGMLTDLQSSEGSCYTCHLDFVGFQVILLQFGR